MPYAYLTRAAAVDALALRLADPSKVRWIADELVECLRETHYTWQAATGMWDVRSEPTVIAPGTAFIDIPSTFPSLCGYSLFDQDLIGPLQYHLYEPKSVSLWTGSEMFTLEKLTAAIQRRRDQFLLETGCRLTRTAELPVSPDVIAAGTPEVSMADTTMDIRRAMWIDPPTGRASLLRRTDAWRQRAFLGEAGQPRTYSMVERAPQALRLSPEPGADGRLDLLTIESGAALNPATGVLLGIPDNFAWVIKWGALADLLGEDGPARDYARALFCERRYRVGIVVAAAYRTVSDVWINGRAANIVSIESLDAGTIDSWQTRRGRITKVVAPVGMNLLALCLPPSATISMQLSVARNAPFPAADDELLQVGREYLDTFLGYAQHLAMFKIMGTEFAATTVYADTFFEEALSYNKRIDRTAFDMARLNEPLQTPEGGGVQRQTGQTVR